MNPSLLKKLTLAALLAGTIFTAQAALKVGDTLPDLVSFKLEGKIPKSLEGKVVIMSFWASSCRPCVRLFPVLEELQKKFGSRLVVVAVNVDEKRANMDNFLKKHPVAVIILRDSKQKLAAVVEPAAMSTTFILDGEGKVRFLHNDFHGEETRKQYFSEVEALLK